MNIFLAAAEAYEQGVAAAQNGKDRIALAIPALQMLTGQHYDKETKMHIINAFYQGYDSVMDPDAAYDHKAMLSSAYEHGREAAVIGLSRKLTITVQVRLDRGCKKGIARREITQSVHDAYFRGYDDVEAEKVDGYARRVE